MTATIEGFRLLRLGSVDSTNNYAANWVNSNQGQIPAVIMADYQEAGRGQRGNSWEADYGENLTCSLVIKPWVGLHEVHALNMRISLSIAMALEDLIPDGRVQIKWPNDILVDRKKIAGILVENSIKGDQIEHSIIGAGINVNQVHFQSENATSVRLETGVSTSPEDLLTLILKYWNQTLADLPWLEKGYLSRLMGYQQEETYAIQDQLIQARITGVDRDGSLTMENSNGEPLVFREKEIRWVRTG